ncbi:MAG: serine/threonine-protein kinase, partial [Planctomycetaceae bacterium]
MAVKIALESFVAVLRRSKLLTEEQLRSLLDEYQRQFGRTNDSRHFAEFMVAKRAITPWQGDKLLQGKHKGFFLGKYRLLSLVGKGGMSSVYLAEHVLMRRRCAIKVLPARRLQNPSYLARFHREAQAVAALDHRNIVRAYDIDHEMDGDIDIHFLVMEYVDGKGLLDLVINSDLGRLPPVVAAEYIRQAALGLQHAHSAGLVHRDIKPGNLLVDTQGTVKLLDLGLARFFESAEEVSLTVQHDERVLGTADYLAPEQAVDSHRVDARADIYALGCTLYLCLTGQPPFTQGTLAQRLLAHQTREPPTVESIQPGIPQALGDIVRRMMAKAPDDRYQTAGDVAAALEAWVKVTPKTDLDRSFAGLDRQTPKPAERPREPDPAARKDTVQAGSLADASATPQVEPRRKPAAP